MSTCFLSINALNKNKLWYVV